MQRRRRQVAGTGQQAILAAPAAIDLRQPFELRLRDRTRLVVQREQQRRQGGAGAAARDLVRLEGVAGLEHAGVDRGRILAPAQNHRRRHVADLGLERAGPARPLAQLGRHLFQAVVADRRCRGAKAQCHEPERHRVGRPALARAQPFERPQVARYGIVSQVHAAEHRRTIRESHSSRRRNACAVRGRRCWLRRQGRPDRATHGRTVTPHPTAHPMIKPRRLRRGSRVAAVSLSWGGPGAFPHRYAAGKRQFEEEFGVAVTETAHALHEPEWLARNPRARADDLMAAFADPAIDGIVATIGGSDSIRLLPYLDLSVIRNNPKVFLGYSDTTVTHCVCRKAGLVSFYGPSFMAGFAENGGMFPYLVDSVRRTLFELGPVGTLPPNEDGWTVEHLEWEDPSNQSVRRRLSPCTGWVFHQGPRAWSRARCSAAASRCWTGCAGRRCFPRPNRWTAPFCFWRPRKRQRRRRRCDSSFAPWRRWAVWSRWPESSSGGRAGTVRSRAVPRLRRHAVPYGARGVRPRRAADRQQPGLWPHRPDAGAAAGSTAASRLQAPRTHYPRGGGSLTQRRRRSAPKPPPVGAAFGPSQPCARSLS